MLLTEQQLKMMKPPCESAVQDYWYDAELTENWQLIKTLGSFPICLQSMSLVLQQSERSPCHGNLLPDIDLKEHILSRHHEKKLR